MTSPELHRRIRSPGAPVAGDKSETQYEWRASKQGVPACLAFALACQSGSEVVLLLAQLLNCLTALPLALEIRVSSVVNYFLCRPCTFVKSA